MVYAQWVRLFECLYNWELRLRGVVNVDAACTRGRQQLCCGRCNSEYIAGFWVRRVDSMEGKVLFRLDKVRMKATSE